MKFLSLKLLPCAVLALAMLSASAQSRPDLTQTVTRLDSELFGAYNECKIDTLSNLVAEDLEFYHDKTGLAVGRKPFLESIRNNICGKVTRELVPGTLEIYPLQNYGALEIGVHRFHHPGHDDTEPVGEGKFAMLWQNKDGKWTLTRVISYDHVALPK